MTAAAGLDADMIGAVAAVAVNMPVVVGTEALAATLPAVHNPIVEAANADSVFVISF